MSIESISVPAERIPPVASDMASSSKVAAGLLGFLALIAAVASLSVLGDDKHHEVIRDAAEAAGYNAGTVIGCLLFVGLPGWFGFKAARNASRATNAARLAQTNPSYTWQLADKYIIAADAAGVPHPELSFKVNGKLRTMLLAVPRAQVVDKA